MTNNTTFQYLFKFWNAIVSSNVIVGEGATLQTGSMTGGTFVCNGTSAVTVTEPKVTANSAIVVTLKTVGGTVGAIPAIQTITAGTGFTIAGTASDTSTYNYLVIN